MCLDASAAQTGLFSPLSSYLEVDQGWTLCTWASFGCWRASALFLVWGCMRKVTLKFLQRFFFSSSCSFLQSTWECLAFEEASGFPSTALLAFVIRLSVNELCTRATTLGLHLPFLSQAPLFLVCLFVFQGWELNQRLPNARHVSYQWATFLAPSVGLGLQWILLPQFPGSGFLGVSTTLVSVLTFFVAVVWHSVPGFLPYLH